MPTAEQIALQEDVSQWLQHNPTPENSYALMMERKGIDEKVFSLALAVHLIDGEGWTHPDFTPPAP